MKINHVTWEKVYSFPYFCLIVNKDYYQLSFVILNHHWWIIINRKGHNVLKF